MVRSSFGASRLWLMAGTAVSLIASPAFAQDSGEQTAANPDIVVTAQKRAERLIDVPQSVTALSGEDLDRLAARQFVDFANTVPGLQYVSQGAGTSQISMRGVTSGADVSSTVGIYVDEVPYGSSSAFARPRRGFRRPNMAAPAMTARPCSTSRSSPTRSGCAPAASIRAMAVISTISRPGSATWIAGRSMAAGSRRCSRRPRLCRSA